MRTTMSSSLSPLPLPKETEIPPLPCSKPANATHVKHWSARHGRGNQGRRFHGRDLYITVLDLDGKLLAHGQRADLIGKVLIDLKDPDGKLFMREAARASAQAAHVLARLQVHELDHQEDRAQGDILRSAQGN